MPAANPGYQVDARTVEDGVSVVTGKSAPPLSVDTSVGQSEDRFGPTELLAASLAACLLKNLTRLAAKMTSDMIGRLSTFPRSVRSRLRGSHG
ncbi:MAG: hypothetical protein M1126_00815 [Candidatus Thermoplasmatota archaeon]|nr:hypothetical protein [Candidatus Thermoplasmatota archaeon]